MSSLEEHYDENQVNFADNELRDSTNKTNQYPEPPVATIGTVVLFILSYFGMAIGFSFVLIVVLSIIDESLVDIFTGTHYAILIDAAAFFLVFALFKRIQSYLKGAFSFAPMRQWKTYSYLVLGFVTIYLSQYLVIDVLEWEVAGSQVDTFSLGDIELTTWNVIFLFLAFTVVTPILEEILFRNLIFGTLADKFGNWIGVAVSSIVFGVLHPGHMLSATIMGVVFVLIYRRTGSLIAPIVFHMIWNSFAMYGLLSLIS